MPKPTEAELLARHATRDVWGEALQGVRGLKAGRYGRRYRVDPCRVAAAREKVGLSRAEFAALLGVSVRTLQEWEQGRRQPTGAARTLIRVAQSRPEVPRELAA